MKLTLAAFAFALPVFAQQTTLPGDAAQQLLSHPPNAQAQFLAANAGWQALAPQAGAVPFQGPQGKRGAVLGNFTHQDSTTGAWTLNDPSLSSTSNGWRLDGAAYSVFVRQSGATQHVVTQTYTDYASKHASTLNFTVPTLTYSKDLTLGFTQDGLAWKLIFSTAGFFQIRSVVPKRIGKATHSFPVTSSENLTVNTPGDLIGDAHVGLTRAVMIPRFGHPIPCSAWSYSKGVASFTCDDTGLKDNQLPYIIDPQSEVTLTDPGQYNIDGWCDDSGDCGSDSANVSIDTSATIPSSATVIDYWCNVNTVEIDSGDGQPNCSMAQSYSAGGIAHVVAGISSDDQVFSDSAVVNQVGITVYFYPPPAAATPTFSLGSGTYTPGITVSLSTATSGASIHYTTDGSTPSSTVGTVYTGPILLNAPTVINAVAYGSQWATSSAASAVYYMYASTPTMSPGGGVYTSAQSITLGVPSYNGFYYLVYTTDGSTPNAYSPVYSAPLSLPLNSTTTINAMSVGAGGYPAWVNSPVASATYTITGTVAAPTFSVAPGTYTTGQTVTLSSTTSGAVFRYTTDGSTPTESHGTQGSVVSVTSSATVRAIAYKTNWADSAVSSAAYTITGTIATPTISISGGNCAAGLGGQVCTGTPTITLSTTSSGASIRYTTDGVTTPTETNGTAYGQPFTLSSNTNIQATVYTVQAIGYENTWADSAVASLKVTITGTVGAPVFTPAGGIYTATQSVALSSATSNAVIRYTTDGSTPTETHGTVYASPISIAAPTAVKAIAYETYWLDSAVTAETYYFSNPTGGSGTGGAGSGAPPADSGNGMDPRRVGVRALGSYWGDAGENLDTTSGNLNFSNTVIKPFGRGNWTLPFMLSYNSQMWRKDSGGDWLMGQDVGYGMGWKLQMGSLTPVWSGASTIDHYIFTDASGAEYSLSVNTGGVWTSTEGTYISYDSSTNRIYNNDGSYWVMGCTSAGTEQDAGVMYPTLAENANGNTITIAYQAGQGMGVGNTSARISSVTDTRGVYGFTYTTVSPNDDIQHLTTITGQPGESWALTYASANLASPLSSAAYGATELLASLQQINGVYTPPPAYFSYDNGAEMTLYTTAMGGSISWGYSSNAYSSGVTLHEVTSRSMNQGAGSFTNSHTLSHPTTCDPSGGAYHACTQILDNGAGSKKIYYASAQSSLVLPSEYQETDNNGSTLLLQKSFTWTQNSASNNWYVGTVSTTLNPGGSNAATTSTVQTVDNYGNLTAQSVNDYGSSTVSRSYSLGYVTDTNYTSRYLRNLLGTAWVTANNVTTMLVNYGHDGTGLGALQVAKDQWGNTVTLPQHDSAYDTTVTYRGNVTSSWKMGTSASYAYDIGGNPYKAQDGDGMTISLATSGSTGGSLPALVTPNGTANLATSMTYAASFAPTSVTGANGATQSMTYDGFNRPLTSTSVDGAVTTYSYAYNPTTQTATISTSTTTNGTTTTTTQWRTTTYDGFGRTIKVQTGHDSTTVNTVDTVYGACGCSPLGKVVKVSMPYGPGETEVWTTYTYDGSGRQLTSTVPDGSVTTTSYSGNSVTSTDPAGIWKTNVMDAFGNLTTVYEPDPATGSPSTGPATYYAYNGANQLINVYLTRSGIAQNRTFTYNGSDMLTETTPEAGTVTYTYDNNHHVASRTDAKGQQTQYTYDSYERLAEVRHYTPTGTNNALVEQTNQRVDYYYDTPLANDYTQNYTWGRLSGVVFQAQNNGTQGEYFAYEYSYNEAGRVAGNRMLMTQGSSHLDLKGQYAWDNQGRLTQMTYPSGAVFNYQLDPMGRPITITQANQPTYLPTTATYGSAGQLTSLQWGTNATPFYETRTYNSMLQLTALAVGSPVGGLNMQYVYNSGHNNGRVSQTIDNVLGETVNYSYDYLHRLTGATATNGTWGEAYAYDGFGNLTSKTPTVGSAPAYTASDNPATNAPGPADANGNLTTANVNSTTQWDVENRLAASTPVNSANNYTYVYDPWGRRIWKQDYNSYAGTTTCEAYFYGATGQKLESYSCSWASGGGFGATLQGINTYFGGKMLSEKGVYVATDRLGSVRADSNGVSLSYYPWGEERGQGTADGRTKFATYYRDQQGQDYGGARYYSATNGSFWSADPAGGGSADSSATSGSAASYTPGFGAAKVGNPASWNRYVYALSDPINRFDPIGKDSCNPDVLGTCDDDSDDCGGALSACDADDSGGADDDTSQAFADCVQAAITASANLALAVAGLDLSQIGGTISIQIAGTPDPDGGTYSETELNIEGVNLTQLTNALCIAGFYNNGTSADPQCPGNAGGTWDVGKPHKYHHGRGGKHGRYSGNFRSPSLMGSVQVNTLAVGVSPSGTILGDVQIDVDPFNPAAGLLGMILHGVAQVLPNMITGGDNTYGCN